MTITVKDLCREDESAWEQFVADHPAAVVSYRMAYRDLLVDVLGCIPHYVIALDDEQIVGVLPVMTSIGTLGPVVNALPYFGSHGAPLVTSVAAEQALSTWYQSFVELTDAASAVMIENPMAKFQVEPSFNVTDSRAVHVTALDDPRGLSAVVSGSVRTSIRKAERLGVEVQVANTAFTSLRTLHAASMRPHGGVIKDERFFGAVESRFAAETDYRIYRARRSITSCPPPIPSTAPASRWRRFSFARCPTRAKTVRNTGTGVAAGRLRRACSSTRRSGAGWRPSTNIAYAWLSRFSMSLRPRC